MHAGTHEAALDTELPAAGETTDAARWIAAVTAARVRRAAEVPPLLPQLRASRLARLRDRAYRYALTAADAGAIAAGLVAAVALTGAGGLTPWALALVPLLVVLNKVTGLYDRDESLLHKSTLDELPKLAHTTGVVVVAAWIAEGLLLAAPLDKVAVVGTWVVMLASAGLLRSLGRHAVGRVVPPERCIVLGSAAAARHLERTMATSRTVNAEVVGRVPLPEGDRHDRFTRSGDVPRLYEMVRDRRVDRAIVAPDTADASEMVDVVCLANSLGLKVSVLPRLFEVVGSSVAFDDVEGTTLLGVRRYGLTRSSWMLKRAFDVAASATAVLLLAPIMLAFAVAIRATSPGPVLFRQTRIGRSGRPFEMLKFRTMVDGADAAKGDLAHLSGADGLFKIADDPRVTPVGRILRATSLDELPQLFNVLRGEMSLVGPRPLVPEEDARISGWHRRRQEATPGMTGLWQVTSGAGRMSLQEMVKLDYLYRANWSLWLDAKTILRTVACVLRRHGM